MPPRSTMWRTLCRFVGLLLWVMLWFQTPLAIGASADRQQVFEGAKKEGKIGFIYRDGRRRSESIYEGIYQEVSLY